jgi:hypothetical protein
MSQNANLKKLERKAFLSYHQDGLLDIIIGLYITGFGVFIATGNVVFMTIGWLPIMLFIPLKNRITVPRFGYVRFSSQRQSTFRLALAVVVGVLLLAFFTGMFFFVSSGQMPARVEAFLRQYDMFVLCTLMSIILLAVGVLIGLKRLYIYAALLILSSAIGSYLWLNPSIYLIGVGFVILATGLMMLVRFIRKYPLSGEGHPDATQ